MNKRELNILENYIQEQFEPSFKSVACDFLLSHYADKTYDYAHIIARSLKNMLSGSTLETFGWDAFRMAIANCKNFKQGQLNILTDFLIYLLHNNLYCGQYQEDIDENVLVGLSKSATRCVNIKFQENIYPWNIIEFQSFDDRYPNHKNYIFIPGASRAISQLVREYFNDFDEIINFRKKECYDHTYFFDFTKSLENQFVINNIEDLNDDVFVKQLSYFYKNELLGISKGLGVIPKFYIYVQYRIGEEKSRKLYKKYSIDALKYNTIMSDILVNGFVVSNMSAYDPPAYAPRMLLKVNSYDIQSTKATDSLTKLDFTSVNNECLQQILYKFFLSETESIDSRITLIKSLIDFINESGLNNEITSIEKVDILPKHIAAYKQFCFRNRYGESTIGRRYSAVKRFVKFLEDEKVSKVDPLIYSLLTSTDSGITCSYKKAFTKEEIEQISDAMKKDIASQENPYKAHMYQLYLYAFSIFSISDIRLSSIFAMDVDCVKETLSRNNYKEYKVVVKSKTSGTGFDEYNITKYVKSIIDEVITLTAKFREKAPKSISNKLFITQNQYRSGIAQMNQNSFGEYFARILEKYNIRKLRPAAVRNYYMQNVSNYVFSNNYDPSLIEKLSNHSLRVHLTNYDNVDIKVFCENFYNIKIGDIYLKGTIQENSDLPKEQTVANGCGKCALKKCVLVGRLDCFMCQHFVTTLDCMNYYKSEIDKIDNLIYEQKLVHEQEFLVSKKRLLVAYLEKLMELEGINNDVN